jgi:hypothetical protein
MRVYGALMWSLGKVIQTPEVMRVYISSFWDNEYQIKDNAKLFDAEKQDLLEDLLSLPRNSAMRKVNELVKRTRLVKIHAIIIGHLRNKMPALFGKETKQKELIDNLENEFLEIQRAFRIPAGDFPDVNKFKERLLDKNFSNFSKSSDRLIALVDDVLTRDLPRLMNTVHPANSKVDPIVNPFEEVDWVVNSSDKVVYDNKYYDLGPEQGRLSGEKAKKVLLDSGIPKLELRKIWDLCDTQKAGSLDNEEFALAMWFVDQVQKGKQVPKTLAENMIPPSQRS